MTALIIVLIVIGVLALGTFFAFALVAGASVYDSPEEKARDDMDQEKAIREWLEKKGKCGEKPADAQK